MCLTQANSYVTTATLIRSQIPISLGSLDMRLMLTSSNNYNAFCPSKNKINYSKSLLLGSIVVWLFFGPTFSILGIISRNRRENFLAWSTLPHHRPRHTLPMSSAPLTHKRFSTVKRQRNQVSGSFTDNFFDQFSYKIPLFI